MNGVLSLLDGVWTCSKCRVHCPPVASAALKLAFIERHERCERTDYHYHNGAESRSQRRSLAFLDSPNLVSLAQATLPPAYSALELLAAAGAPDG